MFKLRNKNKKGFSIGEVILSTFVLGVTMVSVLSLYNQGLKSFQDERDSIIASMLAQEGVELARNVRDNNWARRSGVDDTDPATFASFGVSAGNTENDCRISYNSYVMNGEEIDYGSGILCAGASYALYVNAAGFYTHNSTGATATKFRRAITLDYSNSDDIVVTSFVSWDNGNPDTSNCTTANKCVFSQSTLTNWGTGT
ncbi:MAG: hypothetical protein RBS77_01040 [Candidatus Moranbacteria bacterium]|jgi:hypothetical protein|nr:hypothetical protein [Candidatus Moranbacteria bacterium]